MPVEAVEWQLSQPVAVEFQVAVPMLAEVLIAPSAWQSTPLQVSSLPEVVFCVYVTMVAEAFVSTVALSFVFGWLASLTPSVEWQ